MKRIAGYVALVTVVPLAMLLTLEGLASMAIMARHAMEARPQPPFPHVVHDTLIGWVGQPNVALPNAFGPHLSLTHDARGLRVHPPAPAAPDAGDHRIVCSGGSLVYGAGVADSQTMCADLEQALPGVRTIDMAGEGYGIDQAYLRYQRDGGERAGGEGPHPLHLLAFTQADVERITRASDRGFARPSLAVRDGRLVASNLPLPEPKSSDRWEDGSSVLAESRLMRAIERRTGWSDASRTRQRERAWSLAQALVHDLDGLDRARGSRLVLVYLPALSDLRPGGSDARRAAFAASSARAGIPFIDLTPAMRTMSPDSVDWLFITPSALPVRGLAGHYSAAGHRWVAARIAERLLAAPDLARAIGGAP
jgi:hypothetical protein